MHRERRKRVVVVGASVAGLAAAHALRRKLDRDHEVVVVSRNNELVFGPSLVWVPFGLRAKQAISRPLRPELQAAGIAFRPEAVTHLDLPARRVLTTQGSEPFDHLVVATGSAPDYDSVPGIGPRGGHTQSIASWSDATLARIALERFAERPGPIVIGGVQGAACLDLAYEFLLAMVPWLDRRGLTAAAPITFVTPESEVGALGRADGGDGIDLARLLADLGIAVISGARVRGADETDLELDDGRRLPFAYAMLLPRRVGSPVVARCGEIADFEGFVEVDRHGRIVGFPEIYAVGGAVAHPGAGGAGPPSAGYLAEACAEAVAENLAGAIRGDGPRVALPTLADRAVEPAGSAAVHVDEDGPHENVWLLPGPDARWATRVFRQRFARRAGLLGDFAPRRPSHLRAPLALPTTS